MLLVCISLISLTCNFLPATLACADITGRWYNQLGSEIEIDHTVDGTLQGKYYTRVSRDQGAALQPHDFAGALPYNKPGASFAFSVTWGSGASTTIWTGQCQVCGGRDILETSWLLRSFVESCLDKWKSTLIGKDIFYRNLTAGSVVRRSLQPLPLPIATSSTGNPCSNIQGIWYNDVGSEIILNQSTFGVINGEYRTAVEKEKGSAGTTHSLIYGTSSFGNPNGTFSLMVVWRHGASVTGWVAQCHVCGENMTTVLEMNWLLRTKVENCNDVWKSTMFGSNTFTRHEQKGGPRKSKGTHTPNRDGEDNGTGGTSSVFITPQLWLVFLLLVHVS